MMNNMIVGDIMKEEAALPSKKIPVDGCSRSTLEVPLPPTIMGQQRIGVMEVSNHNDCI